MVNGLLFKYCISYCRVDGSVGFHRRGRTVENTQPALSTDMNCCYSGRDRGNTLAGKNHNPAALYSRYRRGMSRAFHTLRSVGQNKETDDEVYSCGWYIEKCLSISVVFSTCLLQDLLSCWTSSQLSVGSLASQRSMKSSASITSPVERQ